MIHRLSLGESCLATTAATAAPSEAVRDDPSQHDLLTSHFMMFLSLYDVRAGA